MLVVEGEMGDLSPQTYAQNDWGFLILTGIVLAVWVFMYLERKKRIS